MAKKRIPLGVVRFLNGGPVPLTKKYIAIRKPGRSTGVPAMPQVDELLRGATSERVRRWSARNPDKARSRYDEWYSNPENRKKHIAKTKAAYHRRKLRLALESLTT